MDKNIIGEWGADLDQIEYGRALAALGVLESTGIHQYSTSDDPHKLLDNLVNEFGKGHGTVIWCLAYNPVGRAMISLSTWRNTAHKNARALAKAWELLLIQSNDQPRNKPRLAIQSAWRNHTNLFDLDALMGWLGKPEIGCQALTLVPDDIQNTGQYPWHWPIRVGISASPSGDFLMESLRAREHYWVEELAQVQRVGEARESCDLLILPRGMAAHLAEQSLLRLRAGFIICLDEPVRNNQAPDTPAARLLAKMKAAGIALVGHFQQQELNNWYREIIRELSHDMPIHAAIWGVGSYHTKIPPVILGLPDAMDRLRILEIAKRIDRKRDLLQEYTDVTPTAHFGWTSLSEYVLNTPFTSEVQYGLPTAREFSQVEDDLDNLSRPRWLQVNIRHEQSKEKPAKSLVHNGPNLVSFTIGPSDEKRHDAAFPDRRIGFRDESVQVSIQIELTGAAAVASPISLRNTSDASPGNSGFPFAYLREILPAPEPAGNGYPIISVASQNISLPVVGRSEEAKFVVWPQPDTREVTGRVAAIHQNRIIQTARFTAPVGEETELKTGISIQAEQIVHPSLDDLNERRDFDAAFITADDIGGRLHLTISVNGESKEVQLDDMQQMITDIRNTVIEVTRRKGDVLDLTKSEELREVLISLAYHGNLLYQHLSKRLGKSIENVERIQLASFGNSFFPLEYIYRDPGCDLKAQVCPNVLQALGSGICDQCEYQDARMYICPLKFWGLSKVIERHANSQTSPAEDRDRKRAPTPARTPFGAVAPVIFAASDKAFNFSEGDTWKQRLIVSLGHLGTDEPLVAQDWHRWRNLIKETTPDPKLLILLPHSDTVMLGIDVLEIGQQDQLPKNLIKKDLIGAVNVPQLLILLGCATAQVTKNFAPYPELFHDAGADIIIAPLAPILGADAAPIAYQISELLAKWMANGNEVTFGQLMRRIRCDLLAQGHPGVLGLINFGDADWIFGGYDVTTRTLTSRTR